MRAAMSHDQGVFARQQWKAATAKPDTLWSYEQPLTATDMAAVYRVDANTGIDEGVENVYSSDLSPASRLEVDFNWDAQPHANASTSALGRSRVYPVSAGDHEVRVAPITGKLQCGASSAAGIKREPIEKPVHCESGSAVASEGSQAKRWTSKEEVLFVGSVYHVFAEKGSLFPATRKGKKYGEYTKQCESDTFERVNEIFERCKNITGQPHLPTRTPKALCRHFKQMKQRYIAPVFRLGGNEPGFIPLVEEWMALCGETVFGAPERVWFPARHSKNTWSITEEVILVGVVVERFFSRGSLCTNKHRRDAIHCWSEIKILYDKAWTRLKLEKPNERTVDQLARHYKKLKQRMTQSDVSRGLRPYVHAFRLFEKGRTPAQVFWFHED